MLAARPWPRALRWYEGHGRQVELQTLSLTPEQRTVLVDRLRTGVRRENREFLYDSLTDNCSTRLRDLLDDVSGGALRWAAESQERGRTFRDDTRAAAAGSLVLEVGLDLVTGQHQDTAPTAWEAMYRPVDLQQTVRLAARPDGTPLAGPIRVVHASSRPSEPPSSAGSWLLPLAGLFAVVLGGATMRPSPWTTRAAASLMIVVGLLCGLVGLVIALSMAIAVVPSLSWNENVLVLVPLDLSAVVLGVRWLRGAVPVGALGRLGRRYVQIRAVGLGALVLAKLFGASIHDNWGVVVAAAIVVATLLLASSHGTRRMDP